MSTLADIIQSGYRELNLVAIGKEPTPAQSAEGLTLLNRIYDQVFGGSAGNLMYPWPLGNYGRQAMDQLSWSTQQWQNPIPNAKLVVTNEEALTVYLPTAPSDGARIGIMDPYSRLASVPVTLDGNGYTIENAATLLLNTDDMDRTWLFRQDLGNWARLSPLIATDPSPFPSEYDDYFSILLALRFAPRAGRELASSTSAAYAALEKKFVARYYQSAPLITDRALMFNSKQSYRQWVPWTGPYSNTEAWRSGWPW
jgi:hypothetical protein